MEINQSRIKDKINFFKSKNQKVHVTMVTSGFFRNGFFESDIIDNFYYLFQDDTKGQIKIFLVDIFDVSEYRVKGESNDN